MKSLPNQDPVIVRRKRIEAGLTQGGLAAAAEISQAYMSMLENGSASASAPVLKRLASVLSCEIADLMAPQPTRSAV
ncbi:transcriptional regulator with XRE-family HTH domain [Streptomyces umbrinus]|uniref:helix-turn-helix domain-containing protein n=1 Tax=Streptomyces umbrinus TaxID=67370 RepID=UPI00167D1731|nr:helix-turn-helix transcriptional regulator [Streptomyces umbrinus]MCR3732224.1 transcriptional regulator with XRE-family HTH domain [Streptomyces umbrinus]